MMIRSVSFGACLCLFSASLAPAAEQPNVVLIVCDDLNDYIEALGGHPQAQTPNIERLCESGVCFTQAHCNIPICAPSRSSFLTGLYPHTSRNFGFDRWDQNEVLQNSRTIMDHFRANGYSNFNAGKILLILEGMAGLKYSIPDRTLSVCDNTPEEWQFMELRIPMTVEGGSHWPRVFYQREDHGGRVKKTISVSQCPLRHVRIQPWLEEGTLHAAPDGFTTDGQARNHIGYKFEAASDPSVTVEIKK